MPRTAGKMTIYTLGKKLGLSPSTVSKALNHSPEISAEIRTRVQNLARENQFKPRLVSNRVPNICVLVQQLPGHPLDFSPYLARVMEGVAQYTREEGLEMSILAADVNELNSTDVVRELRRRGANGAVIVRANTASQYFEQFEEQRFAYSSLLSSDGIHTEKCIEVDNGDCSQLLMRHLIERGHQRIGFLDHDPDSSTSKERIAGIRDALLRAGIAEQAVGLQAGTQQNGLDFGRQGITDILKNHPRITALLAFDYMVALGVLRGAADMGLRIPQDLSVGCFDEYPESRFMNPSLTTVGISNEYLGYQAARNVHRQIRNLETCSLTQDEKLQPVLNVRESTGLAAR